MMKTEGNTGAKDIMAKKNYPSARYNLSSSPPTPAHSIVIDPMKFAHVSTKEIAKGEYLQLEQVKYIDSAGVERAWEVVGRSNRSTLVEADAVCALPILRRMLKFDCLVLVKQYRPSIKAFTLELPSGILDKHDPSASSAAFQRIKSQTGYHATFVEKDCKVLTSCDPVHTNCTMKIVQVQINGDDILNVDVAQVCGEGEFYEVVQIPLTEALRRLNEYAEEGYIIDSRVYTFALGLSIGFEMGQSGHEEGEEDVQIIASCMDQAPTCC